MCTNKLTNLVGVFCGSLIPPTAKVAEVDPARFCLFLFNKDSMLSDHALQRWKKEVVSSVAFQGKQPMLQPWPTGPPKFKKKKRGTSSFVLPWQQTANLPVSLTHQGWLGRELQLLVELHSYMCMNPSWCVEKFKPVFGLTCFCQANESFNKKSSHACMHAYSFTDLTSCSKSLAMLVSKTTVCSLSSGREEEAVFKSCTGVTSKKKQPECAIVMQFTLYECMKQLCLAQCIALPWRDERRSAYLKWKQKYWKQKNRKTRKLYETN